jgi:hypothetical protein
MKFITIRHALMRNKLRWGTFGKSGKEPLRKVLIKDLTNEHIQAILDTQHHINKRYRKMFKRELKLRKRFPEYSIKETINN